jgi:uncharacterized protein (DUF1778 family)
MAAPTRTRAKRDQAINIRASAEQRDLIDRAASVLGKSRSEFMVETATKEAQQVLLDQTFIVVDSETFNWFADLLESPPEPTEALKALVATRAE